MRLLSRVEGKLRISSHLAPPDKYAILSHRWLADEEEVSYRDVASGQVDEPEFCKTGRAKLDFCLAQAAEDGIDHVWIDSCCIDRTDKHEVGKSINEMYKYYSNATICYVLLSDVQSADWQRTLATSQWFTRGWTLQELVAPSDIRFYSGDHKYIGDRDSLSRELFAITGINGRTPVYDVPVHKRFEWSLARVTKEPEDMSYCLLGILEVSIVVNYGEGADKARERLLDAVEREHGKKAVRQIQRTIAPPSKSDSMNIGQIRILLQYQHMNARRATIAEPFPHTCEWLLSHPDYRAWADLDLQFLWVKGKAGAGKSTLIKFADQSGRRDCVQISFYFNARGDSLERSVEGMYRTLLHQLLGRAPSTQVPVRLFLEQEKSYTGAINLNLPTLQAAFRTAVRSMTETVQCFIDALDECEYSEVQDMIYFLEDVSFNTSLYVCFASRYYPTITIKSKELLLEEQVEQGQDLMTYVRGRLNAGDDLKQQVIDKANGIFFWVVLVVRLLNAEISAGRMYNIQKRLDELPSELNELLKAIIAPSDHLEELQLSVQWILCAKRSLSPNEYYLAVLIGLFRLGLTDLDPIEPWPRLNPGLEMIRKFVASSSRGLAEVTQSDSPKVQFIHESVRTFFLQQGGLSAVLQRDAADVSEWVHNELKNMCYEYTAAMSPVNFANRSSNAKYQFPFLEYAVSAMFHHAEAASNTFPQDAFLKQFRDQTGVWQSAFFASFRRFHGMTLMDEVHPNIVPKSFSTSRDVDSFRRYQDVHGLTLMDEVHPKQAMKDFSERRHSIQNMIDLFAYKGYVKLIFAAHSAGIQLKTTRVRPLFDGGASNEQEVREALAQCHYDRHKTTEVSLTETTFDLFNDHTTPTISTTPSDPVEPLPAGRGLAGSRPSSSFGLPWLASPLEKAYPPRTTKPRKLPFALEWLTDKTVRKQSSFLGRQQTQSQMKQ